MALGDQAWLPTSVLLAPPLALRPGHSQALVAKDRAQPWHVEGLYTASWPAQASGSTPAWAAEQRNKNSAAATSEGSLAQLRVPAAQEPTGATHHCDTLCECAEAFHGLHLPREQS